MVNRRTVIGSAVAFALFGSACHKNGNGAGLSTESASAAGFTSAPQFAVSVPAEKLTAKTNGRLIVMVCLAGFEVWWPHAGAGTAMQKVYSPRSGESVIGGIHRDPMDPAR